MRVTASKHMQISAGGAPTMAEDGQPLTKNYMDSPIHRFKMGDPVMRALGVVARARVEACVCS